MNSDEEATTVLGQAAFGGRFPWRFQVLCKHQSRFGQAIWNLQSKTSPRSVAVARGYQFTHRISRLDGNLNDTIDRALQPLVRRFEPKMAPEAFLNALFDTSIHSKILSLNGSLWPRTPQNAASCRSLKAIPIRSARGPCSHAETFAGCCRGLYVQKPLFFPPQSSKGALSHNLKS